jgi:hypothetical protein
MGKQQSGFKKCGDADKNFVVGIKQIRMILRR